jgi:hypothetical protein
LALGQTAVCRGRTASGADDGLDLNEVAAAIAENAKRVR